MRIRVASHNRLVITKRGYKIVRGPAALPKVDPVGPAGPLSQAMETLAGTRTPAAATTPSACTSTSRPRSCHLDRAGRGPHHNLGNDGKPHSATWRGVMPALARGRRRLARDVPLHRRGGLTSVTAAEWRAVPSGFSRYPARFHGDRRGCTC